MRGRLAWLAAIVAFLTSAVEAAPRQPVYVGSKVCAGCHSGAQIGDQYGKWLRSKHAKAYAVLSWPDSWKIAQISGLKGEPWKLPVCLGCHATASRSEEWEKDDGFVAEEGLQCEGCHGPGSEYAEESVMRDRVAAMKAGLRLPGKSTCMGCHISKESHERVLKDPTVNIDKAFKEIAHPLPRQGAAIGGIGEGKEGFVGSASCIGCHNSAPKGHIWDRWRETPHAKAWASLGSDKAAAIAASMGVSGDARKSEKCLGCHAPGGHAEDGVGCESCHGAGKNYIAAEVMADRERAMKAGLRMPRKDGCGHCHMEAHGKAFEAVAAWAKVAHPAKPSVREPEPRYLTPLKAVWRPASDEVWVACEAGGVVAVVDAKSRKKVAEIVTGEAPTSVAFTSDGSRAFVTNRQDDTLSVVDAAARRVTGTLAVGDEPHGVAVDREDRFVYVVNTASDDITVIDVKTGRREKTLSAGRGPWDLALSPDGKLLMATNTLSHMTGFRKPLASELTVIDTGRAVVDDRLMAADTNLMMGVAWHPSGEYALATMNRTKNLVPMTRLMQGWTITNGLAVVWRDGTVDQVLLDMPGMGFADATAVAFTPDGKTALVTSSGTDRVAVIDAAKMISTIQAATPEQRQKVLPNHLGKATEFIRAYVKVGSSPRGVAVSPGGSEAFVANAISDSLTVIDLKTLKASGEVDLGGPRVETKTRFGERLFHSANITFRRQFSCHSCHPDGHVDGITYDIEADGIGVSPVDNRTLRGILDTAPFKWEGTNPTLARQCGARLSVLFTRIQPFTPEQLAAVDHYITTIPRPPNRYWTPGTPLSPAQRRGKVLFERTMTNDGRVIPAADRCMTCHMPPYYTNRERFDVGTRQALDRTGLFDVPHLNNIYDHAPYLHNGMARTLEEIWTVYNPYDKHGVTNDMTKDQLNDLIEYLKTL